MVTWSLKIANPLNTTWNAQVAKLKCQNCICAIYKIPIHIYYVSIVYCSDSSAEFKVWLIFLFLRCHYCVLLPSLMQTFDHRQPLHELQQTIFLENKETEVSCVSVYLLLPLIMNKYALTHGLEWPRAINRNNDSKQKCHNVREAVLCVQRTYKWTFPLSSHFLLRNDVVWMA